MPVWLIPLVVKLGMGLIDVAIKYFDRLSDEAQAHVAVKANKKKTLLVPRKEVV
jgi:hypothetical protein